MRGVLWQNASILVVDFRAVFDVTNFTPQICRRWLTFLPYDEQLYLQNTNAQLSSVEKRKISKIGQKFTKNGRTFDLWTIPQVFVTFKNFVRETLIHGTSRHESWSKARFPTLQLSAGWPTRKMNSKTMFKKHTFQENSWTEGNFPLCLLDVNCTNLITKIVENSYKLMIFMASIMLEF